MATKIEQEGKEIVKRPVGRPRKHAKASDKVGKSQVTTDLWLENYTAQEDEWIGDYNPDNVTYETYKKMMRDPVVRYSIFMLAIECAGKLERYEHIDPEIQSFIRHCTDRMEGTPRRMVRNLLEAIFPMGAVFGIMNYEIAKLRAYEEDGVFKFAEGDRVYVVPYSGLDEAIYLLDNDLCDISDWRNGVFKYNSVPFDMSKVFMFHIFRGYEGAGRWGWSLLRPAYPYWYIKVNMAKLVARKAEKESIGVILGKMLKMVDDDVEDEFYSVLQGLIAGSVAKFDAQNFDIDIKNLGSQVSSSIVERVIDLCDKYIFWSTFRTLHMAGAQKLGTQAMVREHEDEYEQVIEVVADEVGSSLVDQWAKPIIVQNYGEQDDYGKYPLAKKPPDSGKISEWVDRLSGKGYINSKNQSDFNFVRNLLGVPEREREENDNAPPPAPSLPGSSRLDEDEDFDAGEWFGEEMIDRLKKKELFKLIPNLGKIQKSFNSAESRFEKGFKPIMKRMVRDVVRQVGNIYQNPVNGVFTGAQKARIMAKASKIKIGFGDDLGRVIEGINIDMHEEGRDGVIKEFTDLLRGWGYVFPRMGLRSAQTAEASAQVSIQGNIPTVGDRVDEIRRWFKAHNAGTPKKFDDRGKIKPFHRWTNQEVTDYYFGMSMRHDDFGIKGLMTPTEAVNWYKGQSLTLAGNVTDEVNGGVQNLVRIGLEEGHSINRITQNIKNFAGNFSNWRSANIARTESAKALNQGRHEVFGIGEKTGFITGYEYMGIMDERITPLCEELTRRSPFELSANNRGYLKTIQPPNHFACRSIMSPVLARESQPRWREPVALKPLGSGGKTYPGFWTLDIGQKVKGKTSPTKVTPPQLSKPKEKTAIQVRGKLKEIKKKYDSLIEGAKNKNIDADMDMILELRKDKPNKILVDRYKRIADQQNRAIKDLMERYQKEQLRLVYTENPARFNVKLNRNYKGFDIPEIRNDPFLNGIREFKKLVPQNALVVDKMEMRVLPPMGERAYYDPSNKRVYTSGDKSTVIHEMGHWLEHQNPTIAGKVQRFYQRRTVGEVDEWLGDRYDEFELTKKDKFLNSYMGKNYGGGRGSSEILSMGIQYMYNSTSDFAEGDSDMFDFIYEVLRGG